MLIIPAERTLDWRHPPLVTLSLILINILVFFGYQSQDHQLWNDAVAYYSEKELLDLETPEYLDYLERRIRLGQDHRDKLPNAVRELAEAGDRETLGMVILSDLDFAMHLRESGQKFWQNDIYRSWLEKRSHLETTWLNQISSIRFGLIPADVGLADLFVYQFLHGDFGHLLGNMIFLFLLGFAVEAVLGRFHYLLAYLACGALSGIFFGWIEAGSSIPLVGASGAISGLMGMYVTIYRLQKIRFFFWAGVYFNYFKAPALWLLPVWIGKELFEYWRDQSSGIAYMAHAGGLAAGSGLVMLFRSSWLQPKIEAPEQEDEQDQEFRKAYQAALEAVSRIDFEQARIRFQKLSEKHPDNLGMLEHLYHLEKLNASGPRFLDYTDRLLTLALKSNQVDLALETYRDALKRIGSSAALPASWHYRMLIASLRHGALKEAEAAFQALRDATAELDMIRDACQALTGAFKQREMATKVQYYQTLAEQLDTHSDRGGQFKG